MARRFLTHLMFVGDQCGKAEEAMHLYVSLFANSQIDAIERYGPNDASGAEGTVRMATFSLTGREFIAIDSAAPHAFTFTPAMSIFVDCEDHTELERIFAALSTGGQVFMPLDNYGFSQRFGWTSDRFGVSWQINLP